MRHFLFLKGQESHLDTNVIGDIEDMPADSGEVIAAGVRRGRQCAVTDV